MATESIVVHIDDKEETIVIKSVRKADGLRRADLMLRAAGMPDTDMSKQTAFYEYPTCVCSVQDPGWVRDMTLQDFIDKVDEQDIDRWVDAAYKMNPQWLRGMRNLATLTAEQEKKLGTSLNGSETPMVNPEPTTEISPASKS